ncbi:hypothetical protein ACOZ38_12210 [Sphaerisporangium viridialbum]
MERACPLIRLTDAEREGVLSLLGQTPPDSQGATTLPDSQGAATSR